MRHNHGRAASISLEVALTLPILTTLLLGVIEWGWTFPRIIALQHIADDACRIGSLASAQDASAVALARARQQLLDAHFEVDEVVISIVSGSLPTAGATLQVELTAPYNALLGAIPTPVNLRASATQRMEHQ